MRLHFYAVLIQTLSRHYPQNNTYGLFPFTSPTFAEKRIRDHYPERYESYSWEKPEIGKGELGKANLETMSAIRHVFNSAKYSTPYARNLRSLTKGYGYVTSHSWTVF